ncbi:Bone morphogenetic protein 3 [Fasciola hepatica]|uniref:Bone morphogenetic protein 3 n=1 Tax=Fasciola hepatica TaxID=6192 RepID=A0A4E0QZR4_FASHE|nr:Bone morphogenetic protein 3 [Fasciola hepatica]
MLPLNESDTVVHIELYFFHQSLLSYGNSTNGFYGPRVSSSVQVELHLRLTDEHDQEVHQLLGAQRTSTVRSGWIKFSLWPHFLLQNSGLNKSRHLEFRFVTRDSTRRVIVTVPARTENAKILGQLYEPYILLYLRQVKHSNDLGDLFSATTFPAESYVSRQAVEVSSKRNLWHSNFHHSGRKNMANLTLLHTDAQKRIYLKRVRRQARYHEARRSVASRTRPRRICSVQSMLVDFAQIGWNRWIISPTHYDARMCVGQCPFPLGQAFHPSNHAVVQMLMHHLDPRPTGSGTAKIHRPCCVPQKLVALHVLYHDQNNHVVLKVYEDMIVESCGCR